MRKEVKKLAVDAIKPRVSERTWRVLRDPLQKNVPPPRRVRPVKRPPAPSLTALARKHRTDKWGRHRYTSHYERHLKHLRDASFTLLEIGIGGYGRDGQGGASLRMWEEYFAKARVVGLDIEDKSFVDGGRIRSYRGSQVDHEVLQRILDEAGDVRVIVDDGSHRPEHIRASFAYLFPRLPDDGIYAIEDTQTSYWPVWGGSQDLDDPTTTVSMIKDLIDGLHWEEFTDETYVPTDTDLHLRSLHAYHNLVIMEKGDNAEGSNRARAKRTIDGEPPAPPVAEQRGPYRAG